jgi:hypothetical protein
MPYHLSQGGRRFRLLGVPIGLRAGPLFPPRHRHLTEWTVARVGILSIGDIYGLMHMRRVEPPGS